MCKYLKIIALSLIFCSVLSCGNAPSSTTNTNQPAASSTNNTTNTNTGTAALTGLPIEIQRNLFENCDYIDYTFFNFNFAMSQGEPQAIKSNISLLSDEVQATIPPECKPIGRKYYHVDGQIVMEAELYFGDDCYFYIYKDGHQSLYGNKLSQQGINFYLNIINQAGKAGGQATG